ncbi:DUF2752 domain-containing protein [Mycolicibacterium pulveris]|uniref:Membrane protein n=1 Tax=Mycolicibacterium pulveris TaxID=36813 RepID=A0A7I7UUW6_MYCPV|nr:DUF2752 domain-containing protein [Mycolicibacterium pulveris]MCV6982496.1 DUF2752 domain-containing protein [Mycolicibacterium pulveris]BBY83846.1 membrane protein [Mycolicibacterium pulveris]
MAPSALTSRTGLYTALGAGALSVGALAYVGLADPHRPGFFFPACPFKVLTGLDCPGCGGLRMVHDLLHVDLAAAVVDNVYLLVGLPLLLIWALTRWRMNRPVWNVPVVAVIIVTAVTWAVARNLPGFPLVPTIVDG